MEAKLLINNKDAYVTWGVRMDDGFLTALCAPCTMKEYIENESRLEHGKRVVTDNAKVASREVTLAFTIIWQKGKPFSKNFIKERYQ